MKKQDKQSVLLSDLHAALEESSFVVYYQPRINPVSNKIVSAEALIRWEHNDWGLVSPDEFIPLAEESGLIIPLGEWVLLTVCSQCKLWKDTGFPKLRISVNVSAKQIAQTNFVSTVRNILEESGLDGTWLEFEITEITALHNEENVRTTIQQLQEMGIKIALDDFGTGYASLMHLKLYNFDTVKIDKSFVCDLETDPDSETITIAILQLAHGLGMNVVAEGVESDKQASILRKHNCDEFQGYLYSPPVPRSDFEHILRSGTCSPGKIVDDVTDQRQFFRINFDYPLVAEMTVDSVQGKKVSIRTTEVLIQNIGPGGLRFLSNINLPVNNNMVLRFNTTIFTDIELYGLIVWTKEYKNRTFEYGLRLIINDLQLSSLTQVLNQLAIELRQHPIIPQCNFLTESTRNFFNRESPTQSS